MNYMFQKRRKINMSDIWTQILVNLENVGIGMLLFFMAYLSNMSFSIYYNIKVLGQGFDTKKILTSVEKLIAYIIGTILLVVVVTTLPLFSAQAGLELPQEFVDTFSTMAIMILPIYASCKYALKAYSKMKSVLDSHTSGNETESGETESVEDTTEEDTASEDIPVMAKSAVLLDGGTINGIPEEKVNKEVGNTEVNNSVNASTTQPDALDYSLVEAEQVITGEENSAKITDGGNAHS